MRLIALAAAIVLAAACSAASTTTADGPLPDLDLSGYAPCPEQPTPPDLPAVPGLVLPPDAIAFSTTVLGPLTQVEGVVAATPLQVRAFYESNSGLTVISAEDERVETEVVVTDGTHRMFVKVQIVCATGSNFAATIGNEIEADLLPQPAGDR